MADQRDVAEQLLDLAREDLAAAKALSEAEGVSASKSGFNAQQAVEKALKSVLAGRGEDFPCHNSSCLIGRDLGHLLPQHKRQPDSAWLAAKPQRHAECPGDAGPANPCRVRKNGASASSVT